MIQDTIPIASMYGILTYIYHNVIKIKQPNVGKYTIHGWYENLDLLVQCLDGDNLPWYNPEKNHPKNKSK